MRKMSGFTIAEVLLVVVILGILAALAIPSMTRTVEYNYWRQAQRLLQMVYDGEQRYFDQTGTYKQLTPPTVMGDWREIFMDDPNPPPQRPDIKITFTVVTNRLVCGPSMPCFRAFARHLDPRGVTRTMWIDQNGRWDLTGWPQP